MMLPVPRPVSLLSIPPGHVVVPHHHIEAGHAGLAVGGGQHSVGAEEGAATEGSAPPGAHQPNLPQYSIFWQNLGEINGFLWENSWKNSQFFGEIRVPACQGYSFLSAFCPPTILVMEPPLTPHLQLPTIGVAVVGAGVAGWGGAMQLMPRPT